VAGDAARGHARRRRPVAVHGCGRLRSAQVHHGYLFTNSRANRLKRLVHDGFGIWFAARRLHQSSFVWPRHAAADGTPVSLTQKQFHALVVGLPWQRIEQLKVIATV
jgi:transposase